MPIPLDAYQLEAVRKLKNGSILCASVGSGKSRTALAYYYTQYGGVCGAENYVKMVDPPDLYIITTAKKRDSLEWEKELVPFLLSTDPECSIGKIKVVIDSWNNIKKYIEIKNAFFIFDEDKVTGKGAWVKAFLKITQLNHWILCTATPGDTWQDYIPVFIANGFYRNRTEFIRKHCVFSRYSKYPLIDHYIDCGVLIKYRQMIMVDIKYSRPTEVHNETVLVDYDRILYKSVFNSRWNPYDNKPIENSSQLGYLIRKVVNSDEDRIEAVKKLCIEHPKAIIFYNYDYELDILRIVAKELNREVGEWNGHKHLPIPDSDSWIYLVNYNSGAEGWNCIETDTIIFYSQNYSYKTMVQAAGRIDRVNTPFTDLYYYHIRSRAGIDIAIEKALRKKKNFNETVFLNGGKR